MDTGKALRLSVVYCQFDRRKHGGALERLIALLSDLDQVDTHLVVVDNAEEGDWYHAVTPRLTHIGGDNARREFSAFDRGRAYVEASGRTTDLYAFVTDAYQAYGNAFLSLIDRRTLQASLDLEAVVGWVDAFGPVLRAFDEEYEAWVRTSLFFVPASLLPRIAPFATALDEERIFGPDAKTPFLADGALSRTLQERLLAWLTTAATDVSAEEGWHSQFELNEETFPFFRGKVCAILREHLLSARMLKGDISAFDFRFIADLSTAGIGSLAPDQYQSCSWLGWRLESPQRALLHSLDHWHCPGQIVHGDGAELCLTGWLSSDPPTRELSISISDGTLLGSHFGLPRPDVVQGIPSVRDERCGFEIRGHLDGLGPGEHTIHLTAPDVGLHEELAKIRVLPRFELAVEELFVPTHACSGQSIPILLDGRLATSDAFDQVVARWNGCSQDLRPELYELTRDPSGVYRYRVTLEAAVEPSASRCQQILELVFHIAGGGTRSWRTSHAVQLADVRPHSLSKREIAGWSTASQTCQVHLKGAVALDRGEECVYLLRDGRLVLEVPLDARRTEDRRLGWFDIQAEVPGIVPGEAEFSLAVGSVKSSAKVFSRWRSRIDLLRPRVHLDLLEVRPPECPGAACALSLAGWVEHHHGISELELSLDGSPVTRVALDVLRPDVAARSHQVVSHRQGFFLEQAIGYLPGERLLGLARPGSAQGDALLERVITVPEAAGARLRIDSEDLAELVDGSPPTFLSAITLSGTVASELDSLHATLHVGHRAVDRQPVAEDGSFFIRSEETRPGAASVRVVFDASGQALYDSGVVEAVVEAPPEADRYVSILGTFMERFGVTSRLGYGETKHLIHLLLDRNRRRRVPYLQMLDEIGQVVGRARSADGGSAGRRPRARFRPEPVGFDAPMRVLFASWGVPSLRHGGGVWMTHLLRDLSKRHEITVLYCYSDHEEEWIEDVRPYADRLIGVRRQYGKPPACDESAILDDIYAEYVPELRAAVDAELKSGSYDLVDYQYTWMLPYASPEVPSVMTVFEEPFSAFLANYSLDVVPEFEKLLRLDKLLRKFYLSAVALPRIFSHLVTVTDEDARLFRELRVDARLYTNGIGVDAKELGGPEAEGLGGEVPRLVILGNYKHPPSVDAACYLAENVFPRLLRRRDVELSIVGAFPTPRLLELAKRPGIEVTGFVDDYVPYLRRATAFVAPIFSGSGMRVKVLEAMACGVPVVATALAMQGIDAVDGEHFLNAESSVEFVEAISKCLEAPDEARRIAARARELVRARHGAQRSALTREAIWREVVEDWQQPRSVSGRAAKVLP